MEILDIRKKNRLIKGIVLNSVVFIGCISYVVIFVVPKYFAINTTTVNINETIDNISFLKKDGVNKDSFVSLLERLGRKKELPDMIFTDANKLNKVLMKPKTQKSDYLSWVMGENGKAALIDKEIQENDRILGNIIPVFTNTATAFSVSDVGNQITIASFISYIEKDILGKYSLVSYVPLGISNITFPDKKDTPVNIGNFKITIDFSGKNSDILSLVDALQKSGKLTIRGGKLISDNSSISASNKDKGLSGLSNLLVNIDAFSLDNIPDVLSETNHGNITLEFYVEGMNYQKIVMLRSLLTTKFEGLQKSITEKGLICTKPGNPLCNETITANAIASIKNLSKNIVAIKPMIDAFKKSDITIDVNKEMDSLFSLKSSLQSIEMTYQRNNSILEKSKKQPTNK